MSDSSCSRSCSRSSSSSSCSSSCSSSSGGTEGWFKVERQSLIDLGRGGDPLEILILICKESFFVWVGARPPQLDELALAIIPKDQVLKP